MKGNAVRLGREISKGELQGSKVWGVVFSGVYNRSRGTQGADDDKVVRRSTRMQPQKMADSSW